AQGSGSHSLHFRLAAVPATRDSVVFHFRGQERGWAVWQFEIRPLEMTKQPVYTASSEFQPVETERLRVVLDRVSGAPVSTFHHIDLFSPTSDTVMMEHDLEVQRGEISGRRRVGTKSGEVTITPVSRPFAPGTVLADYIFIAGAVTNVAPGDSLSVPAYKEFADSLATLSFVAELPTTIRFPAGRIAYEAFTLPNGLRVLYSEDHSTPIVSVDVWYNAGSRNERPGRSGFAHLFEHMMFEGSAHVKKGEHFQLISRAGGSENGSTA